MAITPVHPTVPLLDGLRAEMCSRFWSKTRLTTLSRIAVHCRQFEAWWKWELATHLWNLAGCARLDVFIEDNKRADITLATPYQVDGVTRIDPRGAVCVPIELKTIGTFWGSSPSQIKKALGEPGKKRLADDLSCLARATDRPARPFGVVALLLTDHVGNKDAIDEYVEHARGLGEHARVALADSKRLILPPPHAGASPLAHLMIWAR